MLRSNKCGFLPPTETVSWLLTHVGGMGRIEKEEMKQSREKLIITHEICSKPLVNTPSQRSGINSTKTSNSDDLGDCNINLINTNGSATSGIDGEN